jgi:thimet oligopeptidase
MSELETQPTVTFQDLHQVAFKTGDFATDGTISPEAFKQQCESTVQHVREQLALLEGLTEQPIRENFLMPLDDMARYLANKRGLGCTFSAVHPDPVMRELIDKAQQQIDKLSIEIDQSSRLAYIMEAVDVESLDALDKRFVAHWKRDFRRAGCFLAPDQREQVRQLSEREGELGRKFDRNIVDGQKSMFVTPNQLKGMSDEFLRTHPVREDGKIELKSNYADRMPLLEFCGDEGVRKEIWFLANMAS